MDCGIKKDYPQLERILRSLDYDDRIWLMAYINEIEDDAEELLELLDNNENAH